MFVDDLISAVSVIIKNQIFDTPINVGYGEDFNISEIVGNLVDYAEFNGSITWDTSKPDGAQSKLLDSTIINSLGWKPSFEFWTSLYKTYNHFSTK